MRVGQGGRVPPRVRPPHRHDVEASHTPRAPPRSELLSGPIARRAAQQAGLDGQTGRLPTAAELYISHLPGLPSDDTTTLFGGTLPATAAASATSTDHPDAHLYFLMARPRHIPNRHRLIIWFNGGPGCSSLDGAFVENGPFRVNKDGKTLSGVVSSWNEYATVIFLDQPAGTGFSYATSDFVTELDTAADQVVEFLINLYSIFPELSTMDTYLAGESYAGQYVPYIASAILETARIKVPLKGLVMGNGWYSPKDQYPAYLDYLVQRKLVTKGSATYKTIQKTTEECLKTLHEMEVNDPQMKGSTVVGTCEQILNAVAEGTKKGDLCLNQSVSYYQLLIPGKLANDIPPTRYDTSSYNRCEEEWPPEATQLQRYLRHPNVVSALRAQKGAQWSQCSSAVGSRFWASKSVPSVALLPKLLDEEIPILLYSGDRDLMCCGLGVERMIEGLEWGGLKGFNDTPALEWSVDGRLAGSWKSARGLTFVNVLDASHMVPRDQPLAAHDMLLRFMRVDTLHAAGAAARVPSRIKGSSETGDTVLGVTTPEGETLTDVVPSDPDSPLLDRPMGGGGADGKIVGGSAELGGVKEEGSTTMGKAGMGDGIGGLVAGAGVTVPLLTEKQHEALYGPRRTLFLVLVLVVGGLGIWAWLKWRRTRRVARRAGKGKGRERDREGEGEGDYVRLGERGGSIRLGGEEERVGFGFGVPSRAGGGADTGAGLAVDTRQVFDIGEDDDEEEEEEGEGDDEDEDEGTLGDLGASPGRRRRGSD